MPATARAPQRPLRLDQLNGRQKAAILLTVLGPEASQQLTHGMSPEDLEAISFEIAKLDQVPPDIAEAVVEEWQETERAAHLLAQGGVGTAREILERTLGPERAPQVLKRIEGQLKDPSGFERLRGVDAPQLCAALKNEHPQTVAFILSHLEPSQTAEVLKQFDGEVSSDVLVRMARMQKVLPEVVELVERALGQQTSLTWTQNLSAPGGPAAVAAVLNLVNRSLEQELLDGLAHQDEELCDRIKGLMFTFEDISALDDRALQRFLREVDTKELALALKTATEELRQRLLGVMSQRARDALKEEIEFLGPVRLRDVEVAQASVVKMVRSLEEAGEIVISAGDDDPIVS